MPETTRQNYRKMVEQAHEKFSETVRLAMLSLLGFALLCLMIAFSASDSALLVADPTIKLPFADTLISFQSFLVLAPFLLIVITLYLHIFYGYWLDLETDYQSLVLDSEPGEPPIERLPTLFSLDHPVPRLLTAFIFYWLVPLVLIAITWKALPLEFITIPWKEKARLTWGFPLVFITSLVTAILVFLQIRRCPAPQRQWNRWRWVVMALIVVCMVTITFNAQRLERPLNIVRSDLKEKWLANVDLRDAYATLADFRRAILWGVNLQDAILHGANFEGADLKGAILQGADLWSAILWSANLEGANLEGASFQGADLRGAILQDANFQGAILRDADLREVTGLTKEQIQSAHTDKNTKFPAYFKIPEGVH
jgi:Pentapeptide repeats (8 copies)